MYKEYSKLQEEIRNCISRRTFSGDQMKDDEMKGESAKNRKEERVIHDFGLEA